MGTVLALLFAPRFGNAQDFRAAMAKVDESVGRVVVRVDGGYSLGSGFVIFKTSDEAFIFVTNNHVIEDAYDIQVGFHTGPGKIALYSADIISATPAFDLAILLLRHADGSSHDPQPIQLSLRPYDKGEHVAALGFPGVSDLLTEGTSDPGFFISTLTDGIISRVGPARWSSNGPEFELIQHTAPINHGNSGGALFDLCGNVIGVNTATPLAEEQAEGTFWSSSANTLATYLDAIDQPFFTDTVGCPGVPGGTAGPGDTVVDTNGDSAGQTPLWQIVFLALVGVGLVAGVAALLIRGKAVARASEAPGGAKAGETGSAAALRLVVAMAAGGTKSYPLTKAQILRGVTIGRGDAADLRLDTPKLSREHARLRLQDRRLMLTDLGSTNGTLVDGALLEPNRARQINSQSRIEMGGLSITVALGT